MVSLPAVHHRLASGTNESFKQIRCSGHKEFEGSLFDIRLVFHASLPPSEQFERDWSVFYVFARAFSVDFSNFGW